MSNTVTLNILDIYLDSENPRHEPIDNQPEIIAHLLQNELVRNLGKDISENGLSPLELTGVIKKKSGQYIVVEGNRRLCSLILLNDPDRCPNNNEEKYFRKLSNGSAKYPSKISCVLFEDRESADVWIERRHEGAQDGIGTRQWDADQKTRQSMKKGKADDNSLSQALIDYGKVHSFLPKKLANKILTTASRFLGNPYFRQTLGIVSGRSEADVVIDVDFNEFDKAIKTFFSDLLNTASEVNSRASAKDIISYADKLIKLDIAPTKHAGKKKLSDRPEVDDTDDAGGSTEGEGNAGNASDGDNTSTASDDNGDQSDTEETSGEEGNAEDESNDGEENGSRGGRGSKHDPDKRPYLFDSSFKITMENIILRRICKEIKAININEYPLAVVMLARIFLENLYSSFDEKQHGYAAMETHKRMDKICKNIALDNSLSKAEKNSLAALKKVGFDPNNPFNPKNLGANAHGAIYPNAIQLKRDWDNISAIVEYIIKKL